MSTQTLKDKNYHILGHIETRSDGVHVLKSPHYRILGYYFPRENLTKNEHHQIVGHGNLLTTLLGNA